MQAQLYSVRPVQRGRFTHHQLLDSSGKVCGEASDRSLIPALIEARAMASLLVQNSAKVGQLIACHARYQICEDEFNDDLLSV